MKNYWLENSVIPKVDWDCPVYLQWLKEIWHVEIKEEPRHLWPGQYTISGWYDHEKKAYKKAETEWEKRRQEVWDKSNDNALSLQQLAEGSDYICFGEDYFHWNVETPSWSLHKDGTWNKMLIKLDDWPGNKSSRTEYPGVYASYEEACMTLGKNHNLPPKFEGYVKHLDDFVQSYNYER